MLADPRALTLFEQLAKKPGITPQMAAIIARFESRLRDNLQPGKSGP